MNLQLNRLRYCIRYISQKEMTINSCRELFSKISAVRIKIFYVHVFSMTTRNIIEWNGTE
jgi:hypothetical protein